MSDVYVFGDSHWRVYFPFLNTGAPGIRHEEDGIATVDTTANELSGATMWGLMNDGSRQGARRRILQTLDDHGGVENVGLVFGEVDVRYHHLRYYRQDGRLNVPALYELVTRYRRFIDEDLLGTGRVQGHVFVYFGFAYPKGADTHVQEGHTLGEDNWKLASFLNVTVQNMISNLIPWGSHNIHVIAPPITQLSAYVSDDSVHLRPEVYRDFVLPELKRHLHG